MCDAVAACHDRGVYHRDIKPENFIVTDGILEVDVQGEKRRERRVIVKLSDFGLSTTDMHSADMDCGSAPYMSYGELHLMLVISILTTSQNVGITYTLLICPARPTCGLSV